MSMSVAYIDAPAYPAFAITTTIACSFIFHFPSFNCTFHLRAPQKGRRISQLQSGTTRSQPLPRGHAISCTHCCAGSASVYLLFMQLGFSSHERKLSSAKKDLMRNSKRKTHNSSNSDTWTPQTEQTVDSPSHCRKRQPNTPCSNRVTWKRFIIYLNALASLFTFNFEFWHAVHD